MLFKKTSLYIGLVAMIILSACGQTSVEEKIYDHLEEVIQLELGFAEQQTKIIELEKKEQDYFEQISKLELSDSDEIKKLSKEAIDSIKGRSEAVTVEKESLDEARMTFEKTEKLIEKIKDSKVKEKAEEMYGTMIERYEAYEQLHKFYLQSIDEETKLYELLPKEDITQKEFSEQITVINKLYEEVLQGHDKMNEATNKYNTLKREFYKLAKIDVSTSKN